MSILHVCGFPLYHPLFSSERKSNQERKPSLTIILCLTSTVLIKYSLFNDCSIIRLLTFPTSFGNPYKFPFSLQFVYVAFIEIYPNIFYFLFLFPLLLCQGLSKLVRLLTALFLRPWIFFFHTAHILGMMCGPKVRPQVTRFTKRFHFEHLVPLLIDFVGPLTTRAVSPSLDIWNLGKLLLKAGKIGLRIR